MTPDSGRRLRQLQGARGALTVTVFAPVLCKQPAHRLLARSCPGRKAGVAKLLPRGAASGPQCGSGLLGAEPVAELRTRASAPLLQRAPPRAGVPSFPQPPAAPSSTAAPRAPGHRGLCEKLPRGFHAPAALAPGARAWEAAPGASETPVVSGGRGGRQRGALGGRVDGVCCLAWKV